MSHLLNQTFIFLLQYEFIAPWSVLTHRKNVNLDLVLREKVFIWAKLLELQHSFCHSVKSLSGQGIHERFTLLALLQTQKLFKPSEAIWKNIILVSWLSFIMVIFFFNSALFAFFNVILEVEKENLTYIDMDLTLNKCLLKSLVYVTVLEP